MRRKTVLWILSTKSISITVKLTDTFRINSSSYLRTNRCLYIICSKLTVICQNLPMNRSNVSSTHTSTTKQGFTKTVEAGLSLRIKSTLLLSLFSKVLIIMLYLKSQQWLLASSRSIRSKTFRPEWQRPPFLFICSGFVC